MQSLWLGRVEYGEAWALQRELAALRQAQSIGDTLLLLEHPPTVTVGRGADREHLLVSPESLAANGVSLYEVDRGGDVTYHGPGQLVGYPIFDLTNHGRDLHQFLRQMEAALIAMVGDYGIRARHFPPHTGVWVGDRKIAAIGIKVSRWITTHGFALNVTTPVEDFGSIVPCGIHEYGVTSLYEETGARVGLLDVAEKAVEHFGTEFACPEPAGRLPRGLLSENSEKILAYALDIGNNRC
jgi:lipoyl(octanoyl) transferase